MSTQEAAFQTFVFGRLRDHEGLPLSAVQQIVLNLLRKNKSVRDIAYLLKITVSSIHSNISAIQLKGWLI